MPRARAHLHNEARRRVWALCGALLLWALSGVATAISFTVQVIAVSDQESALNISRDLLRDGYPAYVVRSTGAQGDVYRVRVGAFANRAAALRYADSMPEVGGSLPVPALAEAIPQGIMPLAPRLLWQAPWDGEDVRVLPWPGGMALRVQPGDPLRQALYVIAQGDEVREFEAWVALPLAVLPETTSPPEIDVPMIDLTVPSELEPDPEPGPEPEPDREPDPEPGPEPEPELDTEGPSRDALSRFGALLADPDDSESEAGLMLLRDRWLWPATWEDEADHVREAFRASLVTIVARELGMSEEQVEALAYFPGGEPPPALIVLDLSDPSARDAGHLVALGDPRTGLWPEGPPLLLGDGDEWAFPEWPQKRIQPVPPPADAEMGGASWQVVADAEFVRIRLADGATWRAGAGTPLWSNGHTVLAWDGEHLLLYDFVAR